MLGEVGAKGPEFLAATCCPLPAGQGPPQGTRDPKAWPGDAETQNQELSFLILLVTRSKSASDGVVRFQSCVKIATKVARPERGNLFAIPQAKEVEKMPYVCM